MHILLANVFNGLNFLCYRTQIVLYCLDFTVFPSLFRVIGNHWTFKNERTVYKN